MIGHICCELQKRGWLKHALRKKGKEGDDQNVGGAEEPSSQEC